MLIALLLIIIFLNINLNSQELRWNYIENITILNSKYDEFAPSWNKFEDKLYFNSTRDGYSKFYQTSFLNRKFSTPSLVEGNLNVDKNNQSYITFESKTKAYISTFKMYDGQPYLNIFQTFKKRSGWLSPLEADSLQMKSFCGQATISPDGNTMIFVSDANSLYGDTDLWIAYKQTNGSWGNIIKLNNLCTPGNEITPYFASDDTLYFASDGQEGPGGLDIFVSYKENGIWQNPFPVKEINTEFNESDFCILPSKKEAVFASDRPGSLGGLDLYYTKQEIVYPEFIKPNFQYQFATQVPIVKVIASGSQKFNYINNYFVYDRNLFVNNLKNLPKEYEFIYNYNKKQFDIISQNIKQNHANITCYIFGNRNLDNIEENAITNLLNLNSNQIKFIYKNLPEKIKTLHDEDFIYLSFSSNKSDIFDLNKTLIADSIELQPPILQIRLLIKPQNLVSKQKIYLKHNDFGEKLIYESSENPIEFLLDLRPYKNTLLNTDSLNFRIENLDTAGNSYHHFESMFVSHSIVTENQQNSNDDNYIELYYNFIDDKQKFINLLKNIINEISKDYNNITINLITDINIDTINPIIQEIIQKNNSSNNKISINCKKNDFDIPEKYKNTLIKIEIKFN